MLVNRERDWGWITACSLVLAVAAVAYIVYGRGPGGPSGGSRLGLIYAYSGTAMMVFAVLLGLRRWKRTWPLGRANAWLRGHVWLGILSYPIILFHAGFQFNGSPMGRLLMLLFAIVFISGLAGLILQQFLPRQLIRDVQGESIYEQIPHLLKTLRDEAEEQMHELRAESLAELAEGGGTAVATRSSVGIEELQSAYERVVVPFLADELPRRSLLASAESTNKQFGMLLKRLPPDLREPIENLRSIVDERRQLEQQRRLYARLHWWLLIHVPVSWGMMLLVGVHAVMASRWGMTWR